MRILITITVAFGLVASAASADTMKNCSTAWNSMAAADKAKTTYKAYSAMCLKSTYTVPASSGTMSSGTMSSGTMSSGAMSAQPPAGATGKCKDGTYTMATTHSGACSHHGGVDSWLPGH